MSNTKMLMSGKPVHEVCLTMTSMKTWYLLFLAGFLPIVPTVAEVVGSMSNCDQFLLDGTPPQVPGILEGGNILNQNRYKPICQTFVNRRRFVTLYDIKNKIPVFSAYKYRGENETGRPKPPWKIEPQLEKEDGNKNMVPVVKGKIYNNQAGDIDYKEDTTFDRGHLFPSCHAFTKTDKISTFTLTNIVPQAKTFNNGSWNRMEKCIKCVMDKYCIDSNNVTEGFVVTGAQPSNNFLNNRVNIPSMLWSAFCCYSSEKKMWLASAHWGDNVPDDPKNKYLQTKSLAELHEVLKTADSEFNVFPETKCPLHTTVTEFYPDNKNCDCPPSISTTSAPPTSTSGPLTSSSGPLASTSGPLTSSSGPLTSTSGPLTSTSGPLTSTSGPLTSTSAPLTSTSAPLTSTSAPLTSTSGPLTSTSGPLTSTSGPLTSTSGPLASTSGPATLGRLWLRGRAGCPPIGRLPGNRRLPSAHMSKCPRHWLCLRCMNVYKWSECDMWCVEHTGASQVKTRKVLYKYNPSP